MELVPPNPKLSGLQTNPLVSTVKPGAGALVSIKYNSKFRDLTYQTLNELNNSNGVIETGIPGLVNVNKKLAEKLAAKKKE